LGFWGGLLNPSEDLRTSASRGLMPCETPCEQCKAPGGLTQSLGQAGVDGVHPPHVVGLRADEVVPLVLDEVHAGVVRCLCMSTHRNINVSLHFEQLVYLSLFLDDIVRERNKGCDQIHAHTLKHVSHEHLEIIRFLTNYS
jgi:hypothetical protein